MNQDVLLEINVNNPYKLLKRKSFAEMREAGRQTALTA
jgi:hypothetical protein